MALLSVPGLRARATGATRARAACTRVQALAGRRIGTHRSLGDVQVLRYRSSGPTFEQVDVEMQASATAFQQVIAPGQEPQLAQTAVPRDLLHELQASQDRLQMAKGLHSVCAGSCCNSKHTEAHSTVSAPSATFTLPAIVTDQTSSAAVAPSKEKGDNQAPAAAHQETAAGKDGAVETVAVGVPVNTQSKLQLQPVVYTFPSSVSTTSTSSESTNITLEEPSLPSNNSNGGKVFGRGNIADALASISTTASSPTALGDVPTGGDAATQTIAVPYTADPTTAAPAALQPVKRRARVVRQEGIPVVQMAWAGPPGIPKQFYMPDPLALPCWLEASKPCEAVMSYDSDLVECMWLEADRIATLKREYEEAAAVAAASNPSIHNAGPDGNRPSTKVDFKFKCETQPGERLWLVGDDAVLGAWQIQKAIKLRWSAGHIWRAAVELPIGAKVAFKAVLQSSNQQYRWESGSNHVLDVNCTSQLALMEFR